MRTEGQEEYQICSIGCEDALNPGFSHTSEIIEGPS